MGEWRPNSPVFQLLSKGTKRNTLSKLCSQCTSASNFKIERSQINRSSTVEQHEAKSCTPKILLGFLVALDPKMMGIFRLVFFRAPQCPTCVKEGDPPDTQTLSRRLRIPPPNATAAHARAGRRGEGEEEGVYPETLAVWGEGKGSPFLSPPPLLGWALLLPGAWIWSSPAEQGWEKAAWLEPCRDGIAR